MAQEIKVMTCNIRLDLESDSENRWDMRKDKLTSFFKEQSPEILLLQEALFHQLEFIDSLLPAYSWVGAGRDDGKRAGEFSPILFDTTQFTILNSSTFWLSESPDSVSYGWDAACRRVCTFALIKHKSGPMKFLVFNTHFDHQGILAREESAKLIIRKIDELNTEKFPLILGGDFNSLPESNTVRYLASKLKDTLPFLIESPEGTFTGFEPTSLPKERIDYIFVDGFNVNSLKHFSNRTPEGLFLTDHLPVEAKIFIP